MRISSIKISHFRGIPSELNLQFTDLTGKAVSAIIYGDNGSGKSSIVDALEFGLQSRIERSTSINNPTRPAVFNQSISTNTPAYVEISFDDNTQISREAHTEFDEKKQRVKFVLSSASPHSSFQRCPIVLRRNDILSYSSVATVQKQVYLMKCIYSYKSTVRVKSDPEIIKMQENCNYLKRRRREAIQELAIHLEVDPDDVMLNVPNLNGYVRNRIVPNNERRYYSKKNNRRLKRVSPSVYKQITNLIDDIISLKEEATQIQSLISELTNPFHECEDGKFDILRKLLNEAGEYLYSGFVQISNLDYIKNIEIVLGDKSDVSLEIVVELNTGRKIAPQRIFSEANYDLIILLLHISLFRACASSGQAKFLILDDILQSVDSVIRTRFVEYLLKELNDWQFVITCHDRLWLNQLKYMFQRASHQFKEFNISHWNFMKGPTIVSRNHELKDDMISKALETNNSRLIAAACGVTLEMICQKLSVSLEISIHRKPDDKYTIGDLWPGIKKAFKKSAILALCDRIDSLLVIRNILGCHYNEWANSLSDSEVLEFANSIQELYDRCFCEKCGCWISTSDEKEVIADCKCQSLQLQKV